jgi:hypothetical protein
MPISSIITIGVLGDFGKGFTAACSSYFNGTDIAVIINIRLISDNGGKYK